MAARAQLRIDVLSFEAPPALIDGVFESFRKTYGYQVRNRDMAYGHPVCTRWAAPDAVVTLGRMSDASRTECSQMGARFIEVPLAYEAYVAVVHRDNTWADAMTFEELVAAAERMPFDPLTTWNQLRSTWPSLPITLFGVDSSERSSSGKFAPSREARGLPIRIKRDDAGVPRAVEATYGGLGFMSFATYVSQKRAAEKVGSDVPVKVLAIVNAEGTAVSPSQQTIQDGRYDTLSRPLLLYLNVDRLAYPWVSLFGTHTVDVASQRVGETGFTALDKFTVDMAVRKIRTARDAR
jgi:phosphate transport system substrate-binding protein